MSDAAAATQAQEAQPEAVEQDQPEATEADAVEIASQFGFDVSEQEGAPVSASAKSGAKTDAPEEKPSKPLDLIKDDSLFSEKALSNQPGIGKARSALLAARKEARDQFQANQRTHFELQDRENRIKEAGADLKKRTQAFDAHEKRFLADIDIALNGKPSEVLEALGRIARRSGQELYDGITMAMLEAKKKPQVDPETKAKLSKIDELEAKLKEYESKETQRSSTENIAQARAQWQSDVAEFYKQAPDSFPNIKYFVDAQKAEDVMADLDAVNRELWEEMGRPNQRIPFRVLLRELDRRYSELPREEQPEEQPRQAPKRNGRLPGAGPSPARASTNGSTRELTQEERDRDLAEDSELLRSFGFQI